MNWLKFTCWTYVVFVLQSTVAPSVAIAGAVPHFLLAGLSLAASRVSARQALLAGALWGILADCLTSGRLGAGMICIAFSSWAMYRSTGLSNRGSTWQRPLISVPIIFAGILATALLRSLSENHPVDFPGLCLHAVGSAIYTGVVIVVGEFAIRLVSGRSADRTTGAVPIVANRWRMLNE